MLIWLHIKISYNEWRNYSHELCHYLAAVLLGLYAEVNSDFTATRVQRAGDWRDLAILLAPSYVGSLMFAAFCITWRMMPPDAYWRVSVGMGGVWAFAWLFGSALDWADAAILFSHQSAWEFRLRHAEAVAASGSPISEGGLEVPDGVW